MRRKPRVVYWSNIPAPYMVERFNAIATRDNIEFEAWFCSRREQDRSWTVDEGDWRFNYRYLPRLSFGRSIFALPTPLFRSHADLLVTIYSGLTYLAGWQIARMMGIRTGLWVLPTFDRWSRRRPLRRFFRRHLLPRVLPRCDAVLTSGIDGQRFALRQGAPADRIRFLSHPINVNRFMSQRSAALDNRLQLRAELGLVGTAYLYVGRLWWGKGLQYLMAAFKELQVTKPGTSLLIVGDGPEEDRLKEYVAANDLKNVTFAGFRQQSDLPAIYAAADVLVFPTLGDPYGHVVDEAMACALPVIATTEAGEIQQRVHNGRNGFIVPPESAGALAAAMGRLANIDLRIEFGSESERLIRPFTLERWAEEFEALAWSFRYYGRPTDSVANEGSAR